MTNSFRALSSMLAALPLALLLASPDMAQAAPPQTLSYQGVMTNSGGTPITGTQTVVFSLYSVASGGAASWTETKTVSVANGLFSVTLGDTTPITVPFSSPLYLGVKVGADAEMVPRQPLAASAYAFEATGMDGAGVRGPITARGGPPQANLTSTFVGVSAGAAVTSGFNNAAFGAGALAFNDVGNNNAAIGVGALQNNTSGIANTALGTDALYRNVLGYYNTAIGHRALYGYTSDNNTAIGYDAGYEIFGGQFANGNNNIFIGSKAGSVLDQFTFHSSNILIGHNGVASDTLTTRIGTQGTQTRAFMAGVRGATPALGNALPVGIDAAGQMGTTFSIPGSYVSGPITAVAGSGGTAIGISAGNAGVASGGLNTAVGYQALAAVTSGEWNSTVGYRAGGSVQTGNRNAAIGVGALEANTTGSNNTALGTRALWVATGNNNIGVGNDAGTNIVAGNDNIFIGNSGLNGDTASIRIGANGVHTKAYISGVRGVTTAGAAIPVMVDTVGQLGTVSSSRRVKSDIEDMGDASSVLAQLRPVSFRYTSQVDGARQYGLIAEEVADVAPDLVARTADGGVETVFYQHLTPMLLNEVQKQQRKLVAQANDMQRQAEELAGQRDKVATLERELAEIKKMLLQR